MPQHGTRTMYVHYKCRCEACCKAEHEQYLKRPEAKTRKRTYSKHGDTPRANPDKAAAKRTYYLKRKSAIDKSKGKRQISWHDLADLYGMRCAICGHDCDPSDTWVNKNGRRCIGRLYPTVDHIVPLKHGGTDTLDNVQLAHKHCNSKKGTKLEVVA